MSKMPEFKVAAVRVEPGRGAPTTDDATSTCTRDRRDVRHRRRPGVRHRPEPLHRLRGLRAGLHGVRHPPRPVADPPRAHRPGATTQTAPMVCMHCEDPTCAQVCPADAIKQTEDGIVQSALKPRCIGCSNCVLACPFGVPKYVAALDQMMKCDMCTDRTTEGLKPMCASVCPSEALWYGTHEEFARHPPRVAAARLPVRSPVACARRSTPSSTTSRRRRSTCSPGTATVARRPVRPRGPAMTRERRPSARASRSGGATSPTRPPPRRRSPAASSPATSCSAPGRWPPATSGIAAWTQLRRSTPASPEPIVALADVPVGDDLSVPLPERDDPADPAPRRRPRGRRVQPEVHPPRLRRLLRGRRATVALPVPRGQLRDPHRRRDLRPADRGRSDASTSRSATTTDLGAWAGRHEGRRATAGARRRRWPSTSSSSSPSRCSCSPSPSSVPDRRGGARLGDRRGVRRARCRRGAVPALVAPLTARP